MRGLHTIACVAAGLALGCAEASEIQATTDRDPGCSVPRGYDCATPGFETPLTLDEAIELSRTETVVYLYGPGIQDARLVADVMRDGNNDATRAIPAIAAPGLDVPSDTLYVVILGRVIKHRESQDPVEFYQRFLNRGEIFGLTRSMHARILAGE